MKKRLIASALCGVLLLSSCSALFDAEYVSVTKHATVNSDVRAEQAVIACQGREDMRKAIEGVVLSGSSAARLKLSDYGGDIARDLSEVCAEVPREMPEASYTVNFITYSLDFIVSHYEADVSVVYKRPSSELRSLQSFDSRDELRAAVTQAILGHSPGFSFWSDGSISSAELSSMIEECYYRESSVPYIPEGEFSFFPSESTRSIVELRLTYPYSQAESAQRMDSISSAVEKVTAALGGESGDSAVVAAARLLKESVEYDLEREENGDYSRWYNVYTAYGALVQQKAVGEGFALAMKAIMDAVGVECTVVRGMRNSAPHAWNMIRLENGSWYHVDVSMLPDGVVFFTDNELSSSYRYDTAAYPESPGPSLQPVPEPELPPAPPEPPEPPAPEEPVDEPVEEPVEEPEDGPSEEPEIEPSDEPAEEPEDEPSEEPAEDPEDEPPAEPEKPDEEE